ncbi:hypothetical protein POTOM_012649 [Populus tomentosa]|uniref:MITOCHONDRIAL FERREDOXIN 2 n=1 Tax=Populus tomentosa TaxID=118781 RepID=A0A8X8ALF8_POPTO|nr:hypothetical protein POTOM_012649 [Populus tomentosa]
MSRSRLSRIGVGIVKELSREQCTALCRKSFIRRPYSAFWRSQVELHPESKGLQGSIFQKHHQFSSTATSRDSADGNDSNEMISVTFVDKDGEEKDIKEHVKAHLPVRHGMEYYNKLEDPTDEENDMLDLAFGLTETSRLGCQVIAKPELNGMRLALPAATRNFAVDGYVPKPH